MIAINAELCDGCGVCVEICPDGALYLVDGKAMVDMDLCRVCEACAAACPREAIQLQSREFSSGAEPLGVPAPRLEPQVIQIKTRSVPVSLRSRVLPLVGATAAWAARELAPLMAEYLVERLERRLARQPRRVARRASDASKPSEGGRVQRRHRHRKGRGGSS